ncbi:MAG: MFS transporter [Gammaproteobacteria bacterium]|nr:MFS transporter [Gammaproteobacteria bacterium]
MRTLWLTIYLPSFLVAAGQQALVVLIPLYALALDGGTALAASLTMCRGVGSMLINVPTGLLVARYGDKAVMSGALAAMAAAALLLSTVDEPWAVAMLVLVFGAGSGAWLTARLAHISEAAPLAYRGRALATLGGIQRVGLLVGPVGGGLLVTAFDYDVAFIVAGISALGSLLLIAVLASNQRPPLPAAGSRPLHGLYRLVIEHRHTLATAGMATLGLAILRSSRQLLIPIWGALVGLDEATIGFTFMVSSVIEIAMSYPAGYIIDHKGHKFTAIPCFALLSISVAMLPWVNGFYSLLALAMLAGLGNGFGAGIIMTLGSDYAPANQRGQFLGVWRMLGDGGLVAGPLVIGIVAEVVSLSVASLAVAGLGVAAMLLMAFIAREPRRE